MLQIKFYYTLGYQIEADTIQITCVDIHGIMKVNMKDSNEIRCHNMKIFFIVILLTTLTHYKSSMLYIIKFKNAILC